MIRFQWVSWCRPHSSTRVVRKFTLVLVVAYVTVPIGWAALRHAYGDHPWWLFLVNTLAIYMFVPLPFAMLGAWLARSRLALLGCAVVFAIGLAAFGPLFVPKSASRGSGPTISVMTFNMLQTNRHPSGVIAALRASNADVIGIQELNTATARLIASDLRDRYPYQFLLPGSTNGLGVISRLPASETTFTIDGTWQGRPQVIDVMVGHTHTLVVNVHPVSTIFSPAIIDTEVRQRAATAQALVAFSHRHADTPIVVTTDFNCTDQNEPYSIVTSMLVDSWRDAGWGLGNTFPGADSPGSGRIHVFGLALPMWLARIDFVFHSRQWHAVHAAIGPWDGVSDHRPVVATLALDAST